MPGSKGASENAYTMVQRATSRPHHEATGAGWQPTPVRDTEIVRVWISAGAGHGWRFSVAPTDRPIRPQEGLCPAIFATAVAPSRRRWAIHA